MPAFLLLVVVIPAAYGVTAWHAFQHSTLDPIGMGATAAVLAAVAGVVQFWDLVIRPGPKLGADWHFPDVNSFLTRAGLFHLLIMPLVVNVLFALLPSEADAEPRSLWVVTPAWTVAFCFFASNCLRIPRRPEGPDIGHQLTSGGRR